MALIFNIRGQHRVHYTVAVGMIGSEAKRIADSFRGERVVLGESSVAGVWTAVAVGILSGSWREGPVTKMAITDIKPLLHRRPIVTHGDIETDASGQPYGLDVLEEDDAKSILAEPESYDHLDAVQLMAAENTETSEDIFGPAPIDEELRTAQASFFHRVSAAYQGRCAFTGLSQRSLDGKRMETVVARVDAAMSSPLAPASHGIAVSRTVGFCYRNGLLAIGDDYDILRSSALCAELRTLLDVVNPKARLFLPQEQEDWPDLEAARRHRRRFDY